MNKKLFLFFVYFNLYHQSIHTALAVIEREVASAASSAGLSEMLAEVAETLYEPTTTTTNETDSKPTLDEQVDEIIKAHEAEKAAHELGSIEQEVHERSMQPPSEEADEDSSSSSYDESDSSLTTSDEPTIPISETLIGKAAISGWNMLTSGASKMYDWITKKAPPSNPPTSLLLPQPNTVTTHPQPSRTGMLSSMVHLRPAKALPKYLYSPATTTSGMFKQTQPLYQAHYQPSVQTTSSPPTVSSQSSNSATTPAKAQPATPTVNLLPLVSKHIPKSKSAKKSALPPKNSGKIPSLPPAKQAYPAKVHPGNMPQLTSATGSIDPLKLNFTITMDNDTHSSTNASDKIEKEEEEKKEYNVRPEQEKPSKKSKVEKDPKAHQQTVSKTLPSSALPETVSKENSLFNNNQPLRESSDATEPTDALTQPIEPKNVKHEEIILPRSSSTSTTNNKQEQLLSTSTYQEELEEPEYISERSKIMSPAAPIK